MCNKKEQVPTFGYNLPLWDDALAYRATAVAYMKREDIKQVTHKNGESYSLRELQEAMLGPKENWKNQD